MRGDIIGDFDVAQALVALFVLFFLGLVLYLRREDKREGYPLIDPAGGPEAEGFPPVPSPKVFHLMDGGEAITPHRYPEDLSGLAPERPVPGYPFVPTGDPLLDAVGPAAYPPRRDEPLIMSEGKLQVLPIRAIPGWSTVWADLDPRGMTVIADGVVAGAVVDLWIDRSVKILRYLEVALEGEDEARRTALVPIYYADVKPRRRTVRLTTPLAALRRSPLLKSPDVITAREEDRINAFFAGARFFRSKGVPA